MRISVMHLTPDYVIAKCGLLIADLVRTGSDSDWVLVIEKAQLNTSLPFKFISLFTCCNPISDFFRWIKTGIVQTHRRKNIFRSSLIQPLAGKSLDERAERNEIKVAVRDGLLLITESGFADLADHLRALRNE